MKPVVICVEPSQARYVQAAVGAATQMNVAERIAEAKRLTIPSWKHCNRRPFHTAGLKRMAVADQGSQATQKAKKPRGRSDESE